MKAITIKIDVSDNNKIDSFINSINANEELAACPAGKTDILIAAIGECGIAYAKALATKIFDCEVVVTSIK